MSQEPRHYSVFGADIQNYSGRHALQQIDLRQDLRGLLHVASAAAGVRRPRWCRQDQGDGELALVPGTLPKPRLVADFIRELRIALARYNQPRKPQDRLRLRVAMHCGEAHVEGTGFAGTAPIVASRLLEAPPLRMALDSVPQANLALILSEPMFEAVIGYRDIREDDFRRVRVRVKTFDQGAWVAVPGFASSLASVNVEAGTSAHPEDAVEQRGRPANLQPAEPRDARRGTFGPVVFHGPVGFGDGPVAGRDNNFGNR